MPLFRRGRSRSPSLPQIENSRSYEETLAANKTYLEVPGRQSRSKSLDVTLLHSLATRAVALFSRSPSTTANISPVSSCVSSEAEHSAGERSERSRKGSDFCAHCVMLALLKERQSQSQCASSSSDDVRDCCSRSNVMQGSPASFFLPISPDQDSATESSSEYSAEGLLRSRSRSPTLWGGDVTRSPLPWSQIHYLPISCSRHVSVSSVDEGSELASISQRTSFYDCKSPNYQYPEIRTTLADDTGPAAHSVGEAVTLSALNGSFQDCHFENYTRRQSEGCQKYTCGTSLTLQVPGANNCSCLVCNISHRRRSSLDETKMSQYRDFHKFSSENKRATHSADEQRAIYNRQDPSLSKSEEKPEIDQTRGCKVDWTERAVQGAHIWQDVPSGDNCYLTEQECQKSGPRRRCSACHMVMHVACLSKHEKTSSCKPTFREAGVRDYRQQQTVVHHFIHKKRQEGKCKTCGKSFPQKNFMFSSKEIIGIGCSWCKASYHNRQPCFPTDPQQWEEECPLGEFANLIIPPSWIIKIPRTLAFRSSIKKLSKRNSKKKSLERKPKKNDGDKTDYKPFIVKPIPTQNKKPLIVFVNPRSGGNQGANLIQKFYFYLNPRQVFDLTESGPAQGLELYKKVPNLYILACGGDGTIGWVLSEIDKAKFPSPPCVAVLPLGTGNDLARTLNWGSGYTDEPVAKILMQIKDAQVVMLDRWALSSQPIARGNDSPGPEEKDAVSELDARCSVMNNYFSLGADAHVMMEFHESREAKPQKFNSRIRNKMFFVGAGGKDLLRRTWKDLADHIKIECDGVDLTPKIKELKLHCLLFLNIPNYSSGTTPWGPPSTAGSYSTPRYDDGKLELIGFTTSQLTTIQVGGHGEKLAQCHEVKLTTFKTIPMQVDGEPCRLRPSIITIKLHNQARMLIKQKRTQHPSTSFKEAPFVSNRMRLQVSRVGLQDYENLHYDKEKIKQVSVPLGLIVVERDSDLESVREQINRLGKEMCTATADKSSLQPLSPKWCFLDSTTSERFFRVDQGQEHLHYITDISSEDLYILDPNIGIRLEALGTPAKEAPTDYFVAPVTPPQSPNVDCTVGHLGMADKAMVDAAKRGDFKRFVMAHDRGGNMMSMDSEGMTTLHNAARFNYKDIVKYILEHGPDEIIDAPDKEKGQTALHKAAWYQRRTICTMLVAAGASLVIQDKQGNTPRAQALKAEDTELAKYFEYQEALQRDASQSTSV